LDVLAGSKIVRSNSYLNWLNSTKLVSILSQLHPEMMGVFGALLVAKVVDFLQNKRKSSDDKKRPNISAFSNIFVPKLSENDKINHF
jgi:hypothetical protein